MLHRVILSPHYDDAVFSLAATIRGWVVQGDSVTVVTVFAGVPSQPLVQDWDLKCGFRDSSEAMAARWAENQAAAKLLGFTAVDLDLLEEQYRSGEMLKPVLTQYLDSLPEAHVYCPLAVSGACVHADHVLTRLAFASWLERTRWRNAFLYEDQPYCLRNGIDGKVAQSISHQWQLKPDQHASDPAVRKEAISCYRSQVGSRQEELLQACERTYAITHRVAPLTAVMRAPGTANEELLVAEVKRLQDRLGKLRAELRAANRGARRNAIVAQLTAARLTSNTARLELTSHLRTAALNLGGYYGWPQTSAKAQE